MSRSVFFNMCVYLVMVSGAFLVLGGGFSACWVGRVLSLGSEVARGDMGGVALIYS